MKIGNINLKNNVLLAPMAGVTDLPFRLVCKEMGADIVYTEFVSANGIIRESKKTFDLIKFIDEERPIGVQIFGEDPDVVGLSAKMIYERCKPDLIDINFGCPVPKVTKKGAGSAALKDLSLMMDITSSVVESVPHIPVTIKMRSGWTENDLVFIEAGKKIEKVGIKAISLHPRTTSQRFQGIGSQYPILLEISGIQQVLFDSSSFLGYNLAVCLVHALELTMGSERIQYPIEILLNESNHVVAELDWVRACDRAQNVLACAPRMI